MIRKSILVILTLLTFITLVAYVLSYTVQSKLESFVPGEEPLDGILAKDVPMVFAIGELYRLREIDPQTNGALVQLWNSENGSRAHLRAHAGSIAFIRFEEFDKSRAMFRNERGWGGFEVVELNTFGPWLQMVSFETEADKKWASECFRDV